MSDHTPEQFDTEYTDKPICPACGEAENDAWEFEFDGLDGDYHASCGSCGTNYICTRHCSISYSTKAEAQ